MSEIPARHGPRNLLCIAVRFLARVTRFWQKNRPVGARQRQGMLDILERTYAHSLAVELRTLKLGRCSVMR